MQAFQGRDWYELATLIFSAISSVGTLGAVVVALWLARREAKPRLRLRVGVFTAPEYGQRFIDGRRVLLVNVANVGSREVQIQGWYWRIGYRFGGLFARTSAWVNTLEPEVGSISLNHILPPGHSGKLIFDYEQFYAKSSPMLAKFPTRRWFRLPVFVGIGVSSGEEWWEKLDYEEIQRIAGRVGRREIKGEDL
jgi:hypothetical protein